MNFWIGAGHLERLNLHTRQNFVRWTASEREMWKAELWFWACAYTAANIAAQRSPEQAAIRETKEETGILDIEFIKGFKEKIEYSFKFNGDIVQKEVIFFLAKTNTKQVKISDEHLDYVWLDFNNALNKITYENAKNVLKKSKNYLEKL